MDHDSEYVEPLVNAWVDWCLTHGYEPVAVDGRYALIDNKSDAYVLRCRKNGHYYASKAPYGTTSPFKIWRLR